MRLTNVVVITLLAPAAWAQGIIPWPLPARMDAPRSAAAGARFNLGRPLTEGPGVTRAEPFVGANPDGSIPLSHIAFPVRESAAIAIGHVVTGVSHVTPDGTGVYAEYGFRIDKVLKNNPARQFKYRDILTTQRSGGYVIWPSGHIASHGTTRGIPDPGGRYMLFLEWDPTTERYPIITGYELRDGTTIALDNIFGYYVAGKNSRAFVSEIQTAIRNAQ